MVTNLFLIIFQVVGMYVCKLISKSTYYYIIIIIILIIIIVIVSGAASLSRGSISRVSRKYSVSVNVSL